MHQTICHYEILSIPRDADATTIKKAHRRLALLHHPDKNVHKSDEDQRESAAKFKLIQAAYECLSDPVERKWYDEHRELILSGGLAGNADDGEWGSSFLFDVLNYQYVGCYDGYDDANDDSFYNIYDMVFTEIFEGEKNGYLSEGHIDLHQMNNHHLSEVSFGNSTTDWNTLSVFYSSWESFTSCLSYAWEDDYLLDELQSAPNRRIRRYMEEENKKKRKNAKKMRVEEITSLVRFVKRRDPRVRLQRELMAKEQCRKEEEKRREVLRRKEEVAAAKEVCFLLFCFVLVDELISHTC
jgi:DnaJ family protein A protein 5